MDDLFAVFEENKHDDEDIVIEKLEKPKKRPLDEAQSAEDDIDNESSKRAKIDGVEEVQEEVQEENVLRRKTHRVQIDEFRYGYYYVEILYNER